MTPPLSTAWRGPRWALAVLLAGLSTLGPFSIDTYLPAFAAMQADTGASPAQMQQTLSAYLLGFALMNLFHGALSDSFGRRPVILSALVVFTFASVGCALSDSVGMLVAFRALQGLSAGAGMVVGRAIIRDLFDPAGAQKMMSQVTLYFGIAPAVAPIIGGLIVAHTSWRLIFWFLAVVGVLLVVGNARLLPETLPPAARQPFRARPLMAGYGSLLRNPRFVALVLASGVPFNGFFLYVLSAPVFLGEHLHLVPQQFFWLFLLTVSGVMAGAWWSGRLAGRLPPKRQVRRGCRVMAVTAAANVLIALTLPPHPLWSLLPIALYAFGWSLMVPAVTLMVLDLAPDRRGMASSVQSSVGSLANALVAGVLAPLAMHSVPALALCSAALRGVGLLSWAWVKPRLA